MHSNFGRESGGDVGGVRWHSSPVRIMTSSDSDVAGCEKVVLRVDDHVCTVSRYYEPGIAQ